MSEKDAFEKLNESNELAVSSKRLDSSQVIPSKRDAETNTDGLIRRNAAGQYLVGTGGGPGRARLPLKVREMLKEATPAAAQVLIDALGANKSFFNGMDMVTEPDHDLRMKAANYIIDRIYGKPNQAIVGEDGGPVKVEVGLGLLEQLQKLANPDGDGSASK